MFLIDSANLKEIKTLLKDYSVSGITTNPSLMAKENRTDFLHHLKELRALSPTTKLFVQINAETLPDMLEEIKAFKSVLTPPYAIKVPAIKTGYRLMKILSEDKEEFAATAVANFFQGLEAIEAGAKHLIIYVSRMMKHGHNPYQLIEDLRYIIERDALDVGLIGASFQTEDEIEKAFLSGIHQATIKPTLLNHIFLTPLSEKSVKNFSKDFYARYQRTHIKKWLYLW